MSAGLDSGVLARNFLIAERTLSFDLKNAWKIAGKFHSAALRAAAASFDFSESTTWRSFLDEVRTFFNENPDAEF